MFSQERDLHGTDRQTPEGREVGGTGRESPKDLYAQVQGPWAQSRVVGLGGGSGGAGQSREWGRL